MQSRNAWYVYIFIVLIYQRDINQRNYFNFFILKIFRLIQIKTILANSTFNINELVSKKASEDDDDEDIYGNDENDECSASDDLFEFNEDSDLKNVYV